MFNLTVQNYGEKGSICWSAFFSEAVLRVGGSINLIIFRNKKRTKPFFKMPLVEFEYDLMVPFKGKNIKVSFDDWIFKQDEDVAINRATLTKFGFKVGELTVFFKKN